MPAVFLWAVGLDLRPIQIAFAPPAGSEWRVGTQLFPTSDPLAFTAPNLQYFMDSPTELSRFLSATFTVPNGPAGQARFRVIAHAAATQPDLDAFMPVLEHLVREEEAVYGEFPSYEPGAYTFLLDLVPWVHDDGMEHRNSTSISVAGASLRTPADWGEALAAIAHEFFHGWNIERIRPQGLEPFDFTRENVTCCLWFGEGFTQYYGELLLVRAGLSAVPPVSAAGALIAAPGARVRSAVQTSEYAPFADAAVSNDPTDQSRTFLSYYTYGSALALALDLSLREQSAGRVSLDDYMRELWIRFGKPADPRPGYVARPYSLADLRQALADVSGSASFASAFFDRYVVGHDVPDYSHLLSLAGYVPVSAAPGRAWVGSLPVQEADGGLRMGRATPGAAAVPGYGTPLYEAGIDEGDVVLTIDGQPASLRTWTALAERRPGERVSFRVRRRDGTIVATVAELAADPRVEVVPAERGGAPLTDAQRSFRQAWLGSRQ
jgi:predicted metalloprotease with PDZ domain